MMQEVGLHHLHNITYITHYVTHEQ